MLSSVKRYALSKSKLPEVVLSQFPLYMILALVTITAYIYEFISQTTYNMFLVSLTFFFLLNIVLRMLFLEYFMDKFSNKLLEKHSRMKLVLLSSIPLLVGYIICVFLVDVSVKQIK